MKAVYTYQTLGEAGNEFYALEMNGQLVEYFTTLEALGVAIENLKALLYHEMPQVSDMAA